MAGIKVTAMTTGLTVHAVGMVVTAMTTGLTVEEEIAPPPSTDPICFAGYATRTKERFAGRSRKLTRRDK